jgi:hypothetical protein
MVVALKLRPSGALLDLLILVAICLVLSFFNGFFIKYKLLALYHLIPFLIFLFSNPPKQSVSNRDLVKMFFDCLAIVALVNNIWGFSQIIRFQYSDDIFTGIYSTYSLASGGLALMNSILGVYYFFLYQQFRTRKYLFRFLFFTACALLGFYGAGLVVVLLAVFFTFLKPKLFSTIRVLVISAIGFFGVYYFLHLVKPGTLRYYEANFRFLSKLDANQAPRKIVSFYNYGIAYTTNAKDLLFGSGPGTFNSRSAFIVGSPSYFKPLGFIKSEEQPYYFKNYAYSLWNDTNTSQATFMDGFRNQPFSTLLTFLGEYGLLFTLFFMYVYYRYYRRIRNIGNNSEAPLQNVYRKMVKFVFLLLPFLLLIDNYLEYPEIMLLLVTIIKLLHIEIQKMQPGQGLA